MIHNLTRGLGLLEEAEFTARRDAEQMTKAITDFRDALAKVQAVQEEGWTKDNFHVELTRAMTAVENARMEWNSARLKFPVLSGKAMEEESEVQDGATASALGDQGFWQLCRLGLAITWPLAVVGLTIAGVFVALLWRR